MNNNFMNIAEYKSYNYLEIKNLFQDFSPMLSLKEIKKDYISEKITTKVLNDINLDIFQGEFLVLVGESGCGKTTLLNLIGGMDEPNAGTILFNGDLLNNSNKNALCKYRRENIGFIFQNYNLMPNLTVKQNLTLISELVKNPKSVEEVLDLVKLQDKENSFPYELSGGQQQRVSIARALIKNPRLIIADEPTSALDYETSIEVLEAFENVHRSGATIVMVTHNEEIAKMATRVIRMRHGQLFEYLMNDNPALAAELVW